MSTVIPHFVSKGFVLWTFIKSDMVNDKESHLPFFSQLSMLVGIFVKTFTYL